jgi:hypothetical protein
MANFYMLRDSKAQAFISDQSKWATKQIKYTLHCGRILYYKSMFDCVQGIRQLAETNNDIENLSIVSIGEDELQNYYELS